MASLYGIVILGSIVLFQAIIIHEVGHYIEAKKYGSARIGFKNWTLYTEFDDNLPIKQQKAIFRQGIIFGLIPISLYGIIMPLSASIALPLYLGGCYSDFKQLRKLNKRIV